MKERYYSFLSAVGIFGDTWGLKLTDAKMKMILEIWIFFFTLEITSQMFSVVEQLCFEILIYQLDEL